MSMSISPNISLIEEEAEGQVDFDVLKAFDDNDSSSMSGICGI